MFHTPQEEKNIELVRSMFSEFAESMDPSKCAKFHTPDFMMVSNDVTWDYEQYEKAHQEMYPKRKSLKITYEDIFAKEDKVTAFVRIHIEDKDGTKHAYMVILIAHIQGGKIHRLFEVTYPGW